MSFISNQGDLVLLPKQSFDFEQRSTSIVFRRFLVKSSRTSNKVQYFLKNHSRLNAVYNQKLLKTIIAQTFEKIIP